MADLMFDFIKRLWERIKPYLEVAEHFDWLLSKGGWLLLLGKLAVPVTAAVIAFVIGLTDRIPKVLLFLVVLAAIVLSLGIVALWKSITEKRN